MSFLISRWFYILPMFVIVLGILVVRDRKKSKSGEMKFTKVSKKSADSLQEFFPIDEFHSSGAMVVNGKFRKLIRVGDLNLYSMSLSEIQAVRNNFRETLIHLDHPFQISVQARRANYTDFVRYAEQAIGSTMKQYDNPLFSEYAMGLKDYLKEESLRPRTDRENLIVVGVVPKVGGESKESQLERLENEQSYVEAGLHQIGVSYKILDPIEQVEAIQNCWNRERAVSQRYRDSYRENVHTPVVDGFDVEAKDIVHQKESKEAQN